MSQRRQEESWYSRSVSHSVSPYYRNDRESKRERRDFERGSYDRRDRNSSRYRDERHRSHNDRHSSNRYSPGSRSSKDRYGSPKERDCERYHSRERDRHSREKDKYRTAHINGFREDHNHKSTNNDHNSNSTKLYVGKNPLLPHYFQEMSPRSSVSDSPFSTPPPPPPTLPPPRTAKPNTHTAVSQSFEQSDASRQPQLPKVIKNSKTSKKKVEEVKESFKLLIDPSIKKGHTVKIVRYNGVLPGQPPVTAKDPRRPKSKAWSIDSCDLPLPQYQIDKNFVGRIPLDTIRFSELSDGIDRKFLFDLCEPYGDIREYKVYFDPASNRHLGTGKVVFDQGADVASICATLDGREVMGKIITAYTEEKKPPGYAMFKQLEVECLQYRSKNCFNSNNDINFCRRNQTHQQSTPGTPNISSFQRFHPQAPGLSDSEKPPPPPPLPHEAKSRAPSYENLSPNIYNKEKAKENRHCNKDYTSSNLLPRAKALSNRSGKFSPLLNSLSNSPHSPRLKDSRNSNFRNHRINSKSNIEGISPLPKHLHSSEACDDDDDAMSLSSISSNEESKVEVFPVASNMPSLLSQTVNSPYFPTGNYPMVPPNQTGVMNNQSSFQTHSQLNNQMLPNNLSNGLLQNNMPNSTPNYNSSNSNNFQWPSNLNNKHTEILKNALLPLHVGRPPVRYPVNSQNPISSPSTYQSFPTQHSMSHEANNPPIMPLMAQEIRHDPTPPKVIDPTAVLSPELKFVFSVKTGCARDLSQELKVILKKDTLKKLTEHTAFEYFENWWKKEYEKNCPDGKKVEHKTTEPLSVLNECKKQMRENYNSNQSKMFESSLTTSALLKTLFGQNESENNPPKSSFLTSFRISRRSQLQPSMKASHITRKRKPWPSIRSNMKQRRIEDSEDDENSFSSGEDTDNKSEEDEKQFEQFALRQRQIQKSGSSLYQQKIYSDESSSDSEKSDSEDESSSDESSSDESSSSESDIVSCRASTKAKDIKTSFDPMKQVIGDGDQHKPTTEDVGDVDMMDNDQTPDQKLDVVTPSAEKEKPLFVSMYDEPKRRSVVVMREEREKKLAEKKKVQHQKVPKRKQRKVKVVISEESNTEFSDEGYKDEENNQTIDESKNKNVTETITETQRLVIEIIQKEHDYAAHLPDEPATTKKTSKMKRKAVLKETSQNQQDIYVDVVNDFQKPEPTVFSKRSYEQEQEILSTLLTAGIDVEDLEYLRIAFQQYSSETNSVDEFSWGDHPATILPSVKQRKPRGDSKLRIHKTGCARSEGFYKIPMVEKATYLKSALRQVNVVKNEIVKKVQTGFDQKSKSRENRAMQRRLASSIAEEYGSLLNFNNKLKMRKKALRFAKSSIHNWGLFACETIEADELVCEYVGQMIRANVAEIREKQYEKMGIGSSYLFRLDMESVIDATKHGCSARFINHSCDPNCYAKVILVEGAKKIVIYSKRQIKINEEITYDYKFPIEDDKIPCLCGAATCRGSLN